MALEIVALRHQLDVLQRNAKRKVDAPRLDPLSRSTLSRQIISVLDRSSRSH